MDPAEAERILGELLSANCLRSSTHCRKRMIERGVTVDDIMHAMMTGSVTAVRRNPQTDDEVVTIQGRDIDGMKLTMEAVLLVSERRVLCVTVY